MYTFEQAEKKLLNYGFERINDKSQKGIIILGTFGIKSNPYYKRYDVTVCIFKTEVNDELEFQIADGYGDAIDSLSNKYLSYYIKKLKLKNK
jgi:hypothetical protein